jgi:hypothetical protein
MAVVSTYLPGCDIFKKDYVAPTSTKKIDDFKTVTLPQGFLEGLPKIPLNKHAKRTRILGKQQHENKDKRYAQYRDALIASADKK